MTPSLISTSAVATTCTATSRVTTTAICTTMVRKIAAKEYHASPGGLDGDDDCGQMSAWLLFTAMGFYPVNPASGEYMIGSPMYSRVSIRLQNGKTFSVIAESVSARNLYIQSATLDGKPLNEPLIT